MHWFDHLSSTLVAGAGVLLMGAMLLIRTTALSDGSRLFATQSIQRALTDQIQIDLDNLGMQRPAGTLPVVEETSTRFAFHTVLDTLGTPGLVAYEIAPDGSSLRVERVVDGDVQATWTGVTRFEVDLLDASGAPATTLSVRQVDIHIEREVMYAPAEPQPGQTAQPRVGWNTTVRPISLQYTY